MKTCNEERERDRESACESEVTYGLSSSSLPSFLSPLPYNIPPYNIPPYNPPPEHFLSKQSSKMSLDPVSQIFEMQFIQAWELFEAQKFDEVSPYFIFVTATAIHRLTLY
jgi:hypothetical protein